MSTLPENEFDLEKLFLPAWAKDSATTPSYANYEVREDRGDRRDDRRGPRPPRREGGPRPAGREGFGGDRRGPRPPRPDSQRPRGEGRPPGGGRDRFPDRNRDRNRPPERREPPRPLPELNVSLVPEDKGVEFLARQIKMAGRAYPLFEIAQMILQKPDRHWVTFSVKKGAEGQVVQPLFVCALDDTLWLSEDEAVAHVLKKHFATFYQTERTAAEPPKGKYTFVAQCGVSGVILGPPNHHDYQNQLRKLHSERFSRMPFEVFKSRVKIVRDEEVVKKWVEEQSWKTEFTCLNMPEPQRLGSMEEVEKHFRENHKDAIIKSVENHRLTGAAARNLRCPELVRTARTITEDQRRFPLQIATVLSQQFASHGLQFFKVNKTITHVSVARPHYLDLDASPVSEGVRKIVEYINATPKCSRRQLVEALAPAPPPPVVAPTPAAEGAPADPAAAPAPAPATIPAADPGPTAEQTAVIADLHWLIHQGHVIEFANGTLETAKKPVPKPPKPEKAPAPAETAAPEAAPAETTVVASVEAETVATTPAPEAVPEAAPAVVPEASTTASTETAPAAPEPAPTTPPEISTGNPTEKAL